MSLKIRPSTKADIPQIYAFIKALAVYEKMENDVTGTEADLERTLFGDAGATQAGVAVGQFAKVVIAEYEGKAAGFALYFHNYSTFLCKPGVYLEDLFVLDEFRGKGVGKALLAHLADIAVSKGCGRLEFVALKWNPAIKFYRSVGATTMDEWVGLRITDEALDRLSKVQM